MRGSAADRWEIAVEELVQGERYAQELRGLLAPRITAGDAWSEAVERLVRKVVRSITVARAVLRDPYADGEGRAGSAEAPALALRLSPPTASDVRAGGDAGGEGAGEERWMTQVQSGGESKRRCVPVTIAPISKDRGEMDEFQVNSVTTHVNRVMEARHKDGNNQRERIVGFERSPPSPKIKKTDRPYHDGHQWKKYGQKTISGCKFQREYYRCTFNTEGCKATKQVQKLNEDDPPLYQVKRAGEHTCKPGSHVLELMLLDALRPNQ